jgi:hypothetical protein
MEHRDDEVATQASGGDGMEPPVRHRRFVRSHDGEPERRGPVTDRRQIDYDGDGVPDGDDRRVIHPSGRRTADQRGSLRKGRHWLAITISRHPVLGASIVALAVASVPLWMVLDDQKDIKRQQGQIEELYVQVQESRRATGVRFCEQINTNAAASNATTDALAELIVQGARQSRAFEDIYRQFGQPPYRQRVRQAKEAADSLVKLKTPVLDCEEIQREIDRQLQEAGTPNHGSP